MTESVTNELFLGIHQQDGQLRRTAVSVEEMMQQQIF